ncbi:hypothetical protein B0H16DRAFT_1604277 [Mycena metata]|uniref:Uncharacterized protein n=1 Tax=Mycena metata TaxID=1033252 RepID=A0AAD7HIP5_9AGAR|nr:hypothetical protein B0H16DRAFT_1604277 [Mycena metata]
MFLVGWNQGFRTTTDREGATWSQRYVFLRFFILPAVLHNLGVSSAFSGLPQLVSLFILLISFLGPFAEPIISTVQRLAAYITFSIQMACSFLVGTHCFILISSTTHRNPRAQKTTGTPAHEQIEPFGIIDHVPTILWDESRDSFVAWVLCPCL